MISLLDPTGIRPTVIVAGVILALFFGAQLVNALIPTSGAQPGGPGTGPVVGPGQPGQTLPPIAIPTNPGGPGPGPGGTPLPAGSTLEVGPLRVPLESGWTAQEGPNSSVLVRLVKGSVAIDIVSLSITGGTASAAGLYTGYLNLIGTDASGLTSSPPNSIQVGAGIPAARGSYTGVFGGGAQIEGEITAFLTGATDGWVFDAWGGSGSLGALLPETERMVDNVQLR